MGLNIKDWTVGHYTVIGAMLVGLATIVGGLNTWAEALKPTFIAGALTIIGSTLKSITVDKPGQ